MVNNEPHKERIEIRSSEMHDIIGRIPSRILRWGISVIFAVVVALLTITWFIRYPDVVLAKVVITTTPAPVSLVARTSGNLTLLKSDNENVEAGTVVAYIQSNAALPAIEQFERAVSIDSLFTGIPSPDKLGDLLAYHNALLNAQIALVNFHNNKTFDVQIFQLRRQQETYQKLKTNQVHQLRLARQELVLAREKYNTDSLLYTQKVTAQLDFNTAKTTWFQQQRSLKTLEGTLLGNEVQINQLDKQIAEFEIQKIDQLQKLELSFQQAKQEAIANLIKWKENFLFGASANGKVSYLGFLENNQFIESGKACFSIVPHDGEIIARAEMPLHGSGKVKIDQNVNIRLENYPFEEFGLLHGKISSISLVPSDDKYWITIKIPAPLITSQNRALPFKQQLTGTTEIITEDLRLLERFFNQFRKLAQTR